MLLFIFANQTGSIVVLPSDFFWSDISAETLVEELGKGDVGIVVVRVVDEDEVAGLFTRGVSSLFSQVKFLPETCVCSQDKLLKNITVS